MKGKNATTSFLPKKGKVDKSDSVTKSTYIPDRENKCFSKGQAKHIYEMVEMK